MIHNIATVQHKDGNRHVGFHGKATGRRRGNWTDGGLPPCAKCALRIRFCVRSEGCDTSNGPIFAGAPLTIESLVKLRLSIMNSHRRSFPPGSAAAARLIYAQPTEKVRTAVIGTGGRGSYLLKGILEQPDATSRRYAT